MRPVLRSSLKALAPARRSIATTATLAREQSSAKQADTPLTDDHAGRPADAHVTNSKDELDIHSEASGKGQRARQSGDANTSAATSQKDPGDSNKKATKNTKAPGPVIGMQDERGGVSRVLAGSPGRRS